MVVVQDRSETMAPRPAGAGPAEAPPRRRVRRSLTDAIPTGVAVAVTIAWVAALVAVFSTQPPPPDPVPDPSTLDVLVSSSFTLAMLASFVGLSARQRWGLAATVGGGLVLLGAGALCFLTGHTGGWIAVQMIAGAGLAGAATTAQRHF